MPVQYQREQVVHIINSVISKVNESQSMSREAFSVELQSLKSLVQGLRQQLGETSFHDIHNSHIPSAADELDAVAGATEEATVTIMDACEKILSHAVKISAQEAKAIESEVTRIYEACTFQDITGQRISKVIRTLKAIDTRISGMLSPDGHVPEGDRKQKTAEVSLLNGPALPGQGGLSQEEIDSLLG